MSRQNWKAGNMLYPVPAVMVACTRPKEKPNIITIAWAGTVCSSPAMLSISVRPERYSYDIIKQTGEFTVNLVTPQLAKAADYCGVRSGRQVDKFEEMHLTPVASQQITAPGIGESPVILECKVRQILELGTHHMFVAEVVNVSVDVARIDENGKFHLNQSGPVAYSHGEYFTLGESLGKFGYSVQRKKEKVPKPEPSGKSMAGDFKGKEKSHKKKRTGRKSGQGRGFGGQGRNRKG